MKVLKNIISISLTASILSASFSAYGNGDICKDAFKSANVASTQISKSITVHEHFKKLGILKTDQEVELLNPADKLLYLSMMDLAFSKAQEILQLFATFPILTSPKIKDLLQDYRISSTANRETYLRSTRSVEREQITSFLTECLMRELGLRQGERAFILTEDLEYLDSIDKESLLNVQKRIVRSYGLPDTMTKEIAQFFNPMKPDSNEAKLIQALFYRNFEELINFAFESKSKTSVKLNILQFLGSTALSGVATFFGIEALGPAFLVSSGVTAFDFAQLGSILGAGATLLGSVNSTDSFLDKVLFSRRLEKSKLKKQEQHIRLELLQLAGLDPSVIKALPSVQQLKKLPKPETNLAALLIPPLLDRNSLAYPSVDLDKLENTLESKIALQDIENLQPSFDAINEFSENPFSILSYGVELIESQYLIIGRETTLNEKFKEIAERMTIWQEKRNKASTERDRVWVVEERIRLLKLLTAQGKENESSWAYLTSLEKAIQRFDNYLIEIIKPRAGKAKDQIEKSHETFEIALDQIKNQFLSLEDRAASLAALISHLKRSI